MNIPYFHDSTVELHVGDALQVMDSLSSASVDCVVTSPPHWGLRDYGTATWTGGQPECQHTLGTTPHQRRTTKQRTQQLNAPSATNKRCRNCDALAHDQQYGLEPTIDDYVDRLREMSTEVWRLLNPQGTYWLNLRDSFSYQNNGTGRTQKTTTDTAPSVIRHKSLMGIPWRVALTLQQDGWIIRNAMVWHKPNGIPDPASDRFSARYEMVFLLVKQAEYYFDATRALEPFSQDRPEHRKNHRGGNKPHTIQSSWSQRGAGKNVGDVWSISTRPLPEAHCAPFPIDLPLHCIAAGCPDDGRVLDPFSGAGTSGLAARQLGRSYQGIDLQRDYHDIALRRLADNHPPVTDLSEAA